MSDVLIDTGAMQPAFDANLWGGTEEFESIDQLPDGLRLRPPNDDPKRASMTYEGGEYHVPEGSPGAVEQPALRVAFTAKVDHLGEIGAGVVLGPVRLETPPAGDTPGPQTVTLSVDGSPAPAIPVGQIQPDQFHDYELIITENKVKAIVAGAEAEIEAEVAGAIQPTVWCDTNGVTLGYLQIRGLVVHA